MRTTGALRILDSAKAVRVIAVVAFVAAMFAPQLMSLGTIYIAASIAINVLLALSMTFTLGFGGYFSLGQGASFGLGCYIVAVLSTRFDTDLSILLIAAAVGGAVASAAIAISCLRVSNLYLAMVTLAYGFVLADVALNWTDVTGGGQGLSGIIPPLFGVPVTGPGIYLTAVVLIFVVVMILTFVRRNRVGRALAITRESEVAAQAFGIDTKRSMVLTFAAGGAVSATAGGLYVSFITLADPTVFDFNRTVTILTFVVLAGLRSTAGVIVVAPILLYLQQAGATTSWGNWLPLIYSLLVIVILSLAPSGVSGLLRDALARFSSKPRDHSGRHPDDAAPVASGARP
jgi:branched-chain amino acid transport system ATP-binding protein/branched-chain amino acid transport system permease protein